MALDIELPLWTIRPNWTEGVLERLSWLTDVIPSSYGPEQRRALRITPRREFEMGFNPIDNARSYFELFLHRFGSEEFMLPLFHDRGKLAADIVAGTVTIPVDTVNREFVVGGMAVLLGDDPFTYDKLEVTAVAAASINVNAGGVTRAWPKGASLYPLRRSRIEQESQASALTNRVGQGTLLFQLNQDNPIADEGAWGTLYGGHPVMLDKPNRREVVDLSFLRNSLTLDNEHGLIALGDDAGRAFTTQTHMEMIRGRAEHAAFRQFLYRLRGQQGTIWVPTFNQDFVLSQPAISTDAALTIRKIGYGLTGGAISGRRHVLVNDSVMAEIIGTGAEPSAAEELLTLSGAVGTALLAGTRGSFMDTCRLASDDIEIVHHTDTDGLAECNLSFRSFRDERVPPAITAYPIPAAARTEGSCGASAAEEAGCAVTFQGVYYRVWVDIYNTNEGGEVRNDGIYNIERDDLYASDTTDSDVVWIGGRFGELTNYGTHTGGIFSVNDNGGDWSRPGNWWLQEQHSMLTRDGSLYNIPGLVYDIYIQHYSESSWTKVGTGNIGGSFPNTHTWTY